VFVKRIIQFLIFDAGFEWPELGFGWSLADVIKKQKEKAAAREREREERKRLEYPAAHTPSLVEENPTKLTEVTNESPEEDVDDAAEDVESTEEEKEVETVEAPEKGCPVDEDEASSPEEFGTPAEDVEDVEEVDLNLEEEPATAAGLPKDTQGPTEEDKAKLRKALQDMMEIGTWSNDMAEKASKTEDPLDEDVDGLSDEDIDMYDPTVSLPMNLEMITRTEDPFMSSGDAHQPGFRSVLLNRYEFTAHANPSFTSSHVWEYRLQNEV
jgi:hypothetical protein